MQSFREQILSLISEAQSIHAQERTINLRSVYLVGELERCRAAPSCGMSIKDFAKHIGLVPVGPSEQVVCLSRWLLGSI